MFEVVWGGFLTDYFRGGLQGNCSFWAGFRPIPSRKPAGHLQFRNRDTKEINPFEGRGAISPTMFLPIMFGGSLFSVCCGGGPTLHMGSTKQQGLQCVFLLWSPFLKSTGVFHGIDRSLLSHGALGGCTCHTALHATLAHHAQRQSPATSSGAAVPRDA